MYVCGETAANTVPMKLHVLTIQATGHYMDAKLHSGNPFFLFNEKPVFYEYQLQLRSLHISYYSSSYGLSFGISMSTVAHY